MPTPRAIPSAAPRGLLAVTVLISALLHWAVGTFVSTAFRVPKLNLEFQVPLDVEFGMTDAVAAAPVLPGAPSPDAKDSSDTKAQGMATDPSASKATDSEPPRKRKPKQKPAENAAKSAASEPSPAATEGTRAALPAGTQIAVRVDMARIRQSPLAEDVRGLLAAIPDWKALLDGSGIDPIADLDRFMIATPNLERAKIVVAGRYVGPEQTVFDAVKRLADAHGGAPNWRTEDGVRVANWENLDETPRVIALVGPAHFAISREEDLPRVLAVAVARATTRRSTDKNDPAPTPEQLPADALLSMEQDEGLSVEIEGAEKFVRRAVAGVPTKLRLSAVEQPGPSLLLRGQLFFADATKAAQGAQFWDQLRSAYAANALVAMLGLAQPLKEGTVVCSEQEVQLTVRLSVAQAQLILGYLRELVRPPPGPPGGSANGASPAAQVPVR